VSTLPQQPYFLRALYEWCVDSGYTPYISVRFGPQTRVPTGFVKDGQIVLNIGPNAVRNLQMDNDWVMFSARFGGVSHEIQVPVSSVLAIYARESGEGMAFPQTATESGTQADEAIATEVLEGQDEATPPDPDKPKGRPNLRLIK
jgi:stringent starvation protein B